MQYLQPLCPGIVYSNIFDNNSANLFLHKIRRNVVIDTKGNKYINNLIEGLWQKNKIRLGIIGMEFLDGGNTLYSTIKSRPTERFKYHNYVRYSLLKLALDTEYNHADFHTGNLMVVPDNNYIFGETERIMIIDYGRSLKIPPDVMSQLRNYVQTKNYMIALEQLCLYNSSNEYIMDPQYAEVFYGYICGNYNTKESDYSLLPLKTQNFINNNLRKNIAYKNDGESFNIEEEKQKINDDIDKLFENREKQIDINIQKMNELHDSDPSKYPLIPVSNSLKNSLYNGMIGGKRRRKTFRRKTRKHKSKSVKY